MGCRRWQSAAWGRKVTIRQNVPGWCGFGIFRWYVPRTEEGLLSDYFPPPPFVCVCRWVTVRGDVPNDAGWIKTNTENCHCGERTVRVTEQVLFPDVLLVVNRLLRWSYYCGLQGIATTYDPSNLLQGRSVGYALSLGRNQLIACIREHSATNYGCMPAGNWTERSNNDVKLCTACEQLTS